MTTDDDDGTATRRQAHAESMAVLDDCLARVDATLVRIAARNATTGEKVEALRSSGEGSD